MPDQNLTPLFDMHGVPVTVGDHVIVQAPIHGKPKTLSVAKITKNTDNSITVVFESNRPLGTTRSCLIAKSSYVDKDGLCTAIFKI